MKDAERVTRRILHALIFTPAHAPRVCWAETFHSEKRKIRLYAVLVSRMITCDFHPRSPSACCKNVRMFSICSALHCLFCSPSGHNESSIQWNGALDKTLWCLSLPICVLLPAVLQKYWQRRIMTKSYWCEDNMSRQPRPGRKQAARITEGNHWLWQPEQSDLKYLQRQRD